jgi:hypothetical protein
MSKTVSKFSFNEKSYPIVITWSLAYNTLPEKFNIEILKLFVDEQLTQSTTNRILVDDDLALRLCWFFLESQVTYDWDKFLELLDSEPEAIENFRETFWSAIVNFSSPQKKGVLLEIWKVLKREMKQLSLDMDKSSRSLSEQNPEEST